MRSLTSLLRPSLVALVLALAVAACDSGESTSLYDPGATGNAAPVIESVSPTGVVLAGIDVITITGRNFSATPSENVVTFDDGQGASAPGVVLEATTTMLRVRVPNLPNAALRLRVAVLGAPDYSAPFALPLVSAKVPFGNLDPGIGEAAFGIASDAAGVLYVSLGRAGTSTGIVTIALDGTRTPYFTTTSVWTDLAVGAGGSLFGVRRLRAVFRLPQGGAQETFATFPTGVALSAIAAAPNGDLWTGGTGSATPSLYRVAPDRTTAAFPFAPAVKDLAVAGGALYVAAVDGTTSQVWRFPFDANGGLGAGTVVFDVTAANAAVEVTTVAVAADGTLFVGTASTTPGGTPFDPIFEVAPSGTAAPLYPGVLRSPASAFAWGPGTQLYVAKDLVAATASTPLVPAELYRLETRRAGPN